MTAKLPIGVVGVGALGRHHARHLAKIEEADLVGVFDIDPEVGRAVAEEVGTTARSSLDDLLGRVSAVSIAVPTPEHLSVGIEALRRGIPVLMEKPLAGTLDDADQLVAAATKALYLEGHRVAPFQPRGTDVAVVLDLMIHDLDLMLHLTGGAKAIDVRASGVAVLSQHLDMANARVEFDNGAVALATASRLAKDRVRRLRLVQPSGYMSLDMAAGTGVFMKLKPGWRPGISDNLPDIVDVIPLIAPEADALNLELTSFIHAVQGEREAVITGAEGRRALALALKVTESVRRAPIPHSPG